ncbi:hypothetical protein BGW41_001355 [Actinomortierella wolfii]|nr:hypothetical protein BGW41_001355 [Actinomortierella wolfii]
MSNPAVLAWLQEIAAAKSTVEAKQTSQVSHVAATPPVTTPATTTSTSTSSHSTQKKAPSAPRYGIFVRYPLKTRRAEYSLVLPPPPRKPEPGECCGNDCVPCINTLYWEDLEVHQQIVARLQREFEQIQQWQQQQIQDEQGGSRDGALVDASLNGIKLVQKGQYQVLGTPLDQTSSKQSEGKAMEMERLAHEIPKSLRIQESSLATATATAISAALKNEEDDDGHGLSIRAYRPFRILEKTYVNHDTLRVVCDVDAPTPARDMVTFHVLIRFELADGRMVTKAFTPVAPTPAFYPPYKNSNSLRNNHTDDALSSSRAVAESVGADDALVHPRHRQEQHPEAKVDNNYRKNKLTFLIKLYPPPHETSALWRALPDVVAVESKSDRSGQVDQKEAVLYMRGPIHTGFHLNDRVTHLVMIAAGSGITPMLQVLQEFQRRRQLHEQRQQEQGNHEDRMEQQQQKENKENKTTDHPTTIDLIFCNRTASDIWLREELVRAVTPPVSANAKRDHTSGATRRDSDQVISKKSLSSSLSTTLHAPQPESVLPLHTLTPTALRPIPYTPGKKKRDDQDWTVAIHHVLSSQTTSDTMVVEAPEKVYHGRLKVDFVKRVLDQTLLEEDGQPPSMQSTHAQPSSLLSPQPIASASTAIATATSPQQQQQRQHQQQQQQQKERLVQILVCGPPSFNRDMQQYLDKLGYTSATSSYEVYIFD